MWHHFPNQCLAKGLGGSLSEIMNAELHSGYLYTSDHHLMAVKSVEFILFSASFTAMPLGLQLKECDSRLISLFPFSTHGFLL